MKNLKVYAAVILFIAATALTGCKKDDGVAPAKVATHQTGVMDSGGQEPPPPPPK